MFSTDFYINIITTAFSVGNFMSELSVLYLLIY
jgi:hypothetical protein